MWKIVILGYRVSGQFGIMNDFSSLGLWKNHTNISLPTVLHVGKKITE